MVPVAEERAEPKVVLLVRLLSAIDEGRFTFDDLKAQMSTHEGNIIGFITGVAIIWTIGIIVVIAGAILALLGMAGHAVGGRRHYY